MEWVDWTCKKRRVDRLVIEDASSGYDVNQELMRVVADRDYGLVLVPAKGDKWARAHAVVDMFTDDMIFAPGEFQGDVWCWRDHAQIVIDEMCQFPRGQHDDLIDSMVMALAYLRKTGLAVRREEWTLTERLQAQHRPKPSQPLYPC